MKFSIHFLRYSIFTFLIQLEVLAQDQAKLCEIIRACSIDEIWSFKSCSCVQAPSVDECNYIGKCDPGFSWSFDLCQCVASVKVTNQSCYYVLPCTADFVWNREYCTCLSKDFPRPSCEFSRKCRKGFFWDYSSC